MRALPLCACIGPRTISAGAGSRPRSRREAEYGLILSSCKRRRLAWQIHHDFERAAIKASSLKDDQMPEMEATDFGAPEARTQYPWGEDRDAPRSIRWHLFEHIKMPQLGYQQVTNR
jgi:hypothetical protein